MGWLVYTSATYAYMAPCRMSLGVCSDSQIVARDPYCIVDPTCVSPLTMSDAASNSTAPPQWHGLAVARDPLLISGNPVRMLALTNYAFFTALVAGLLWGINARIRGRNLRRRLVLATATFCGLEIARWSGMTAVVASEAEYHAFFHDPFTYTMLLAMTFPLAIASYVAWKAACR
jgi:hypothetical protein